MEMELQRGNGNGRRKKRVNVAMKLSMKCECNLMNKNADKPPSLSHLQIDGFTFSGPFTNFFFPFFSICKFSHSCGSFAQPLRFEWRF